MNREKRKKSENSEDARKSEDVRRKDSDAAFDVVLALETGVSGGSISLSKAGMEIGQWVGNRDVSRAEDILDEVDKILEACGVPKRSVDLIAFSKGPGSFTGLRIGAAIAGGLKKALNCRLSAVPVLEALILDEPSETKLVVAVPFGKYQVCWQYFVGNSEISAVGDKLLDKVCVSRVDSLDAELKHLDFEKLILHENLYKSLFEAGGIQFKDERFRQTEIVCVGENLARFTGTMAFKGIQPDEADEAGDFGLVYPCRY